MRRRLIAAVGLLAACGLLGAVGTACSKQSSATTAGAAVGATGPTGATGPRTAPAAGGPAGVTAGDVQLVSDVPPLGPNIIKTGHLEIEVKRGGFDDAFDRASVVAGTYGGFVESSSSQGVKHRSGRLTIRVPAASFEDALHDLRGIGTVQRQSISGRDVTSQFVDLDARLLNYQTQEKVLLRLLSKATTIEGKLFEAGAPPVVQPQTVAIEKPKLSEALTRAEAVFLGLVYGIVVALAVLVPLSLLGLLAWLVVRRYRARLPQREPA